MDTIFGTQKYPVQPGCRYAISFWADDGAVNVYAAWLPDADSIYQHHFILADGTPTDATLALNESAGWEIVAPTNTISVWSSSDAKASVTKIQD